MMRKAKEETTDLFENQGWTKKICPLAVVTLPEAEWDIAPASVGVESPSLALL